MIILPQWKLTPPQHFTEFLFLLYVDDVRTSLEAYASTASCGDSFTCNKRIEVTVLKRILDYEEWCLLGCYAVWLL
jgi:hypothetical protein